MLSPGVSALLWFTTGAGADQAITVKLVLNALATGSVSASTLGYLALGASEFGSMKVRPGRQDVRCL